jgi:hypothetical protein
MTKTETASEALARIEKRFFKGAGLKKACLKKGEERREYVLAQTERLLNDVQGCELMATCLSDQFWTADDDRMPIRADMPLLTEEGLSELSKDESLKARLVKDVAGLCHDLVLHFDFDLKEYLGVRNDWRINNKRLVEWLTSTEYEQIAVHTSYILRKHAINGYADRHYLPAQDAMATLYAEGLGRIGVPGNPQEQPREYVKITLDEMLRIERHWRQGHKRRLEPEVVILHDEMYGFVPRQFSSGVLAAAQELYDWMDSELMGKGATDENIDRFVDKLSELRQKHFGKGWIKDFSLEFNYLLSHGESCAEGYWQKGGKAL